MGNNCSSKICKNPGKIVEFDFREVVGQKSGAVINMELFLSVSFKILQKFLELFKKVHTHNKLILELVNIWIRNIILIAKIWQTVTGVSVIFIIRISVSQLLMYFYDSSTQSVIVNNICFWIWALLCTLGFWRLFIVCSNWLQSYHEGIRVPISYSRFQSDKHGSHFSISLIMQCSQK